MEFIVIYRFEVFGKVDNKDKAFHKLWDGKPCTYNYKPPINNYPWVEL